MSDNVKNNTKDFIDLVAGIVSAYVSKNPVRPPDLPDLIRNVHSALNGLANGTAAPPAKSEINKPTAAQIRRSVAPDGIISFLDGKTYKTLKRHLGTRGLDPHSYRVRFGLPADYPMVAPAYAAMRSELARSIRLGQIGSRSKDEVSKPRGRKRAA